MRNGVEWNRYRDFHIKNQSFTEEYKSEDLGINGIFFDDSSDLIAVMSHCENNYLYLNDKLVLLGRNISAEYYCGVRNEESWIKIIDHGKPIFSYSFVNENQDPYIDFASGMEDWDVFNWAYDLSNHINKAKENPKTLLFPDQYKESS